MSRRITLELSEEVLSRAERLATLRARLKSQRGLRPATSAGAFVARRGETGSRLRLASLLGRDARGLPRASR